MYDTDRATLLPRLLADARLNAEGARTAPSVVPSSLLPPAIGGDATVVPPPEVSRHPLESALRARNAAREFDADALSLAEVSALLYAADDMDSRGWQDERAAGLGLEILCVAWRVTGLGTALHSYDPANGVLHRIAPVPTGAAAEDLVLQREFASAPVILTFVGPLAAGLARHGSHGHRMLLLRAGAAAHAAWIAALRLGLVGSVFAGLLPHVLRERAAVDGYLRAPLFALAVGRPPVVGARPTPQEMKGGET
jgi:hypothetical protein